MKVLLFVLAAACSAPTPATPEPASHAPAGPTPHESSDHRPIVVAEPALESLDADTSCGRAQACCRAFAAATPHVDAASACAETVEVAELADADERCERMTIGWRVALEHNREVDPPAACGGGG